MFLHIVVFIAGFLDDFISTWHTKCIANGWKWPALISDILMSIIWYIVIRAIVQNLENLVLFAVYAAGNAAGLFVYMHTMKDGKYDFKKLAKKLFH